MIESITLCKLEAAMGRQQLLSLLDVLGEPYEIEVASIDYRFDFSLKPLPGISDKCYEIGRNDSAIPIVVDSQTGHIFFVDPQQGLLFINSSFRQMLAAFEYVRNWNIPDDAEDLERVKIFETQMLKIDKNVFQTPSECWSIMREEISRGLF